MKAKLIVFDIAGTTLQDKEDAVATAFSKAMEANGFEFNSSDIKSVMGYKKREAIKMLLNKKKLSTDENLIGRLHDTFITEINDHYRTADIREIDGISDLFKKLKNHGLIVALNTGFSRSTTDIIINRLKWLDDGLIDESIASDEVAYGRPEPDMIRELSSRFEISDPRLIFKIGDTPSDLLEGKNAGCGKTIGVLYGTHNRPELEGYPHDYLAEDIEDLTNEIFSNGS
ncbi:MAG: HAD hydrolase-like protein [Balneolaceae bacterium]|nr:HAD hydrolase-like protein [Balneolaceae bacterium]